MYWLHEVRSAFVYVEYVLSKDNSHIIWHYLSHQIEWNHLGVIEWLYDVKCGVLFVKDHDNISIWIDYLVLINESELVVG